MTRAGIRESFRKAGCVASGIKRLPFLFAQSADVDIGVFKALALLGVLAANVLAHVWSTLAAASDESGVESLDPLT